MNKNIRKNSGFNETSHSKEHIVLAELDGKSSLGSKSLASSGLAKENGRSIKRYLNVIYPHVI
jgi:hypothetical protein